MSDDSLFAVSSNDLGVSLYAIVISPLTEYIQLLSCQSWIGIFDESDTLKNLIVLQYFPRGVVHVGFLPHTK